MNNASKDGDGGKAGDAQPADRPEPGMSPAIRELILNFVTMDAGATWNPDAYTRATEHAH